MNTQFADNATDLKIVARAIFADALRRVDPAPALRRIVQLDGTRQVLHVGEHRFDLRDFPNVFSIAVGKAAGQMALALSEALNDKLTGGVISAPSIDNSLPACWKQFVGGHPLPNEASFAAAHSALELLQGANTRPSLVFFLVSGGGSAMMERPRDARITLEDMRAANHVLVTCGAPINEINAVRRRLSRIKGGGLSAACFPPTKHVTLIVSDTNTGDEANVASGPTLERAGDDESENEIVAAVLARYDLPRLLPLAVTRALAANLETMHDGRNAVHNTKAQPTYYVLLDNQSAINAAVEAAHARGFIVVRAADIVEQDVAFGCAELVSRLSALKQRAGTVDAAVCLVSGGEFVCPLRGEGVGGRNAEAALRSALELNARFGEADTNNWRAVALHAGTDGIDGNSPAAGAVADETTVRRAHVQGLEARAFLTRSDAYTFFKQLGDTIETGATGTNVRDLRILLAR